MQATYISEANRTNVGTAQCKLVFMTHTVGLHKVREGISHSQGEIANWPAMTTMQRFLTHKNITVLQ